MVNVNNYGVNGTNYTTSSPKVNQGQIPNNQPANPSNKPNDKFAFESNNMPAGKVPTIGMWDKMSAHFKHVMNTPQNLQSFKKFEQAIKSNPQGFLEPGSVDMGRVKDVQKKLNYLGMKMTVNGQFGSATEQAIIRFKRSVGINDGFLDKSGQWAVTPIVTPQTWSLLNSQVANKLNPSTNLSGSSYRTPVTPQEMDWAKQLASKIQQFGYKPSEPERQRYENIYQRVAQNPAQQTPKISAPSAQEMNWAKQLAGKIQQGYKPSPQEVASYQDIFNRNKMAKSSPPVQTQQTQQVQSQQTNQGVSPAEMNWATNLMNKVKGGYKPSADEQIKYQEILEKSQGQQTGQTQNNSAAQQNAPVADNRSLSQQELAWAQQMETKVSQGYNPTAQERATYENIYSRSQGTPTTQNTQQTGQTGNQGDVNPVTQQELNWAQQMENKVNNQGYKPSQQEIATYQDIFKRSQSQSAAPTGQTSQTQQTQSTQPASNGQKPSQQEVSWAVELENKTKQGYKPTQNELNMYNDIATRLQGNQGQTQEAGNTNPPVQNQQTQQPQENQENNDVAAPQALSPSNNDEPFVYNQATINNFKSAFPEVGFKGKSVPYLPDNVAKQVATQYGFGSVSELQSAVGAGVDGKFGPETFFRLDQAKNRGNQASGQTNAPAQNNSVASTSGNQNGVSQADLDWAVQLQDKFSQGYKPTNDEQAKYTDIFKRYEASGNQVAAETNPGANTGNVVSAPQTQSNDAPTQEEVDWASNLQVKVGQGYKPNPQEMTKYTDVFNRYESSGNQVAQATQNTPASNQNFAPPTNQGNSGYQYTASLDPNTPTIGVDVSNGDADLQWALQLLDRVQQQGYTPTNDEITKYEQTIARNQSTLANA